MPIDIRQLVIRAGVGAVQSKDGAAEVAEPSPRSRDDDFQSLRAELCDELESSVSRIVEQMLDERERRSRER